MSDLSKYEKVGNIGEGAFGKAILVLSKSENIHRVMKEINIRKVLLCSTTSWYFLCRWHSRSEKKLGRRQVLSWSFYTKSCRYEILHVCMKRLVNSTIYQSLYSETILICFSLRFIEPDDLNFMNRSFVLNVGLGLKSQQHLLHIIAFIQLKDLFWSK